jgi:hypothetical protein
MPLSNYPFRTTDQYSSPKPVVPVIIYNPANDFEFLTWALIDTGADTTAIPEHVAKALYHDIRNHQVKRDHSFGIGGGVEVYMHTFAVDILFSDPDGTINQSKAAIKIPKRKIAVVPDLHITILGEDFLEDYVLTIDYPGQKFSVKKPKKTAMQKKAGH